VKAWHYFEMLSLFVPANSPEFVSGHFDIAACTGCGGRRLPVERVVYHASTLFLCHAFGMHSEVHLLHVQGLCNMSTQLGIRRFC
jgi:hypothetical protein